MFHRGDDAHSGRGILSCFGEKRCYQQLQKVPFVKWVSAFLFLTQSPNWACSRLSHAGVF